MCILQAERSQVEEAQERLNIEQLRSLRGDLAMRGSLPYMKTLQILNGYIDSLRKLETKEMNEDEIYKICESAR